MYYSKHQIRRILQVIFLVTIIFLLPSCRHIKQRLNLGEYSLKAAIEWARKDSARVADSMKMEMLDKKVFEKTFTDSLVSIEDDYFPEGDTFPRYNVIIGSYSIHDNAEKAAGQYSRQGYKTTIIKGPYRDGIMLELVSVKTFRDRSEADIFLKEFQSEHIPDAWIYSEK